LWLYTLCILQVPIEVNSKQSSDICKCKGSTKSNRKDEKQQRRWGGGTPKELDKANMLMVSEDSLSSVYHALFRSAAGCGQVIIALKCLNQHSLQVENQSPVKKLYFFENVLGKRTAHCRTRPGSARNADWKKGMKLREETMVNYSSQGPRTLET
jgi:hypothetical protein